MPRVPGFAQKNTALDIPPPNKERISLTTTTRMSKSLSSPSGINLEIRTSHIRTSPAGGGTSSTSSSDGRILGIQSDSLNCACTHTHTPIYIHTKLYTVAILERRRKPAAAAWS